MCVPGFSSFDFHSRTNRQTTLHLVRDNKRLEDAEKDVGRRRLVLAKVPQHVVIGCLGHDTLVVEGLDPIARVGEVSKHALRISITRDGLVKEMSFDLGFDRFELARKFLAPNADRFEFV